MTAGPRFLDEDGEQDAPPGAAEVPIDPSFQSKTETGEALPRGPMLLDPAPDAPQRLDLEWEPEVVVARRLTATTALWLSGGIVVLLVTWIALSLTRFMIELFHTSKGLGVAGAIAIALGLGMIAYGSGREWRAYRSLAATERFRAVLMGHGVALETVRAVALDWARSVAPEALTDRPALEAGLQAAASTVEIRALLRNRLADKLREASNNVGRRAALEGATAVAICPHPALDGLAVSLRGLMMVRQIAVLHGVRPGFIATISLMRRIALTAAGTSGTAFLSQNFADHLLHSMPGVRHVAAALPEAGVAAFRLYRLAGITAKACCPV
jgi:putative membrane protein